MGFFDPARVYVLTNHNMRIPSCHFIIFLVIFSPGGSYVACGSQDGSVFVWDTSTMKIERVLKNHG